VKYFVTVNGRPLEAALDGETITIDGVSSRVAIEHLPGSDVHIVRIGEAVHRIPARRGPSRGRYDLSVDGFRIEVEALDERARTIRELSKSTVRPSGPARLTAPMPGLVVRINVNEGDRVRAGQGLVVMEAMKMENELKAAVAGTVRRVLVTPGSAVEKGAILLELESAE